MILEFLRGKLPWSGAFDAEEMPYKELKQRIWDMKEEYTPEMMCEGQPEEILELMKYIRNLEFKERPDYKKMVGIVEKCMDRHGIDKENPKWDWYTSG